MKKIISLFLALTMVASFFTVTVSAEDTLTATETVECEVNVTLNGAVPGTAASYASVGVQSGDFSGGARLNLFTDNSYPAVWTITPTYTGTVDIALVQTHTTSWTANVKFEVNGNETFNNVLSGWSGGTDAIATGISVTKGVPFTITWTPVDKVAQRPYFDCFNLTYTYLESEQVEPETPLTAESIVECEENVTIGGAVPAVVTSGEETGVYTDTAGTLNYSGNAILSVDTSKFPVEWTITPEYTGTCSIGLYIAGGSSGWTANNDFYVNGEKVATVVAPWTSGWMDASGNWQYPERDDVIATIEVTKGVPFTFTWEIDDTSAKRKKPDYLKLNYTYLESEQVEPEPDPEPETPLTATEVVECETNVKINGEDPATGVTYAGVGIESVEACSGGARLNLYMNGNYTAVWTITPTYTGTVDIDVSHRHSTSWEGNVKFEVNGNETFNNPLSGWGNAYTTDTIATDISVTKGVPFTITWSAGTVNANMRPWFDCFNLTYTYLESEQVEPEPVLTAETTVECENNVTINGEVPAVVDSGEETGVYTDTAGTAGYSGNAILSVDTSKFPVEWTITPEYTGTCSIGLYIAGGSSSWTANNTFSVNGEEVATVAAPWTSGWMDDIHASYPERDRIIATIEVTKGVPFTFTWEIDDTSKKRKKPDYFKIDYTYLASEQPEVDPEPVFALYDSSNSAIAAGTVLAAGTYYAKVNVTDVAAGMTPVLYAAVYNGTVLADVVQTTTVTDNIMTTGNITTTSGQTVILYIWNSIDLKPLMGSLEY